MTPVTTTLSFGGDNPTLVRYPAGSAVITATNDGTLEVTLTPITPRGGEAPVLPSSLRAFYGPSGQPKSVADILPARAGRERPPIHIKTGWELYFEAYVGPTQNTQMLVAIL